MPMKRTPYANLILEMLKNDPMLFIRGDEAEESWRLIDPILSAWARGEVPMQSYPAGSSPSGEAPWTFPAGPSRPAERGREQWH